MFNQTYFSNSTDDNVLFDDLNIKDDATIKACVPNFPYVFFRYFVYTELTLQHKHINIGSIMGDSSFCHTVHCLFYNPLSRDDYLQHWHDPIIDTSCSKVAPREEEFYRRSKTKNYQIRRLRCHLFYCLLAPRNGEKTYFFELILSEPFTTGLSITTKQSTYRM